MPSFDIVSELDKHEVQNAVDQANRELATRFDFKGVTASFELEKEENVNLEADADFQLRQMIELLKGRLIARGIDVRCLPRAAAAVQQLPRLIQRASAWRSPFSAPFAIGVRCCLRLIR